MTMNSRYQSLIKLVFLLITIVGIAFLFKIGVECFKSISDIKSFSKLLSKAPSYPRRIAFQNSFEFQTIGFDRDNSGAMDDFEKEMDHFGERVERGFGGVKNLNKRFGLTDAVSSRVIKELWFYGFSLTIGAILASVCGIFAFFRSAKLGGIGLIALGLVFVIWWIDTQPGIAGILLLLGGLGFLVFDILVPVTASSKEITASPV